MSTSEHDWIALLREATDRFGEVVRATDPGAPVAHCPGWSVRDLVDHLGGVHQWAAHAVTHGSPDLVPEPMGAESDPAQWYAERAGDLLVVLTATDPDASAWTLDRSDRTAGFWRRRQVHEVVVHTWDAERASGGARPMDPVIAWDGVLEVVDVMYPRQVRLGRVEPLDPPVRLVATDLDAEVLVGDGGPAVEARATAEVLLRLLWHRSLPEDDVPTDVAASLSGAVTP